MFAVVVATAGLAVVSTSFAQPPAAAGESIIPYAPDYFSVYNPTTALDMVIRLPGFTIDEGDSVRGFGSAAGNVLINGERPSAKRQTLSDILRQIPAKSVERIELIRGRAPGVDMRGQAVVANVITSKARTGGSAEAQLRLSEGGRVTPMGEISLTGEIASVAYTLGVKRFAFEDIDEQPETLFAPDGTALEFRPEEADIVPRRWTLTGNLERNFGDWSARLNNELFLSNLEFREFSPSFDSETGDFLRANTTRVNDSTTRIEVGGDLQRQFSESLSAKLIALQTLTDFESSQTFDSLNANGAFERATQAIDEKSGESILRGVLTITPRTDRTFEAGVEGAYNFLDAAVELLVDAGAGPIRQDLPISDTRVEEYRAELFGNASWKLAPPLTIEAGLTTEFSSLRQSGDAEERRTFTFFKPSLNATYDISAKDQLRLLLRREVAQLDFRDFVSSATLNEQTTDLGNPELEPQRDWIARAEWERRFSEDDAVTLLLEYRRLQQVQALVPIAGEFDAPGNIGGGELWRARVDWRVSLKRIGLANAIFEGWYEHRDASVRDPVTGEVRAISFFAPDDPFRKNRIRAEFRHNFPAAKWAWGWDYFYGTGFSDFRIDEVRRERFGKNDLDIYVETTRFFGATMRLEAGVNEARVQRERVLFDGPRSNGIVRSIEVRDRRTERDVILSVRRSF